MTFQPQYFCFVITVSPSSGVEEKEYDNPFKEKFERGIDFRGGS